MTRCPTYLPALLYVKQGQAKDVLLSFVREEPSGPMGCAFAALSLERRKFKHAGNFIHIPVNYSTL